MQVGECGPRVAPAQTESVLELGDVLVEEEHRVQKSVRGRTRATVEWESAGERGVVRWRRLPSNSIDLTLGLPSVAS